VKRALLLLVLASAGCGGGSSNPVVPDVGGDISLANFAAAGANLDSWRQSHGTYAGAQPGVPGVTLVRADTTSWCLQTVDQHEAGPGGSPQPGPC
jgi:hypothetical protein